MIHKNVKISVVFILVAFILRATQVLTAIDFKTGFYNRDNSTLGLVLTIAVCVLCVASALFSCKSLHIDKFKTVKSMPIISGLTALTLLYELVAEKFTIQGLAWQVILMKCMGFVAALYFLLFALAILLKVKIPDILHTIPAIYMIMRIICSFINISSLSLIAENIFLLASYSCALLFFVSYAAYYCTNSYDVRDIYTKLVLASSVCFATSLSNIVANIFAGYTHISLCSQVVLMSVALFLISFTYEKFFKTE